MGFARWLMETTSGSRPPPRRGRRVEETHRPRDAAGAKQDCPGPQSPRIESRGYLIEWKRTAKTRLQLYQLGTFKERGNGIPTKGSGKCFLHYVYLIQTQFPAQENE